MSATKIKLLFGVCITLLFYLWGNAQVSISYYSSSISKTGVACDFNERVWGELRMYGNIILQDFTPELVFCYDTAPKKTHQTYVGLGVNINHFTGIVVPTGVQFSPDKKWNQFSLHLELQPTFDFGNRRTILQTAWGLRYKFLK